jgi:hypothetical protein
MNKANIPGSRDSHLFSETRTTENGILLTHCEFSGCHFVFLLTKKGSSRKVREKKKKRVAKRA